MSASVRRTVEGGDVHLSVICYWEVVLKSMKGALDVGDPRQWWAEVLDLFSARALPVRPEHVAALPELPPIHRDPFDRMLIAQSLANRYAIVTDDRRFVAYGCRVL